MLFCVFCVVPSRIKIVIWLYGITLEYGTLREVCSTGSKSRKRYNLITLVRNVIPESEGFHSIA